MFKKFFKTKLKVSTDYLIVSSAIVCGIIVMSFTLGIASYKSGQNAKYHSLKQDTIKAENLVSEIINEHHWQIRSVADKIMKSDGDSTRINQIISDYNKFDTYSNFDQFLNQKDIFWVNSEDEIAIKNKVGILDFPQRVPKSYEVFNAREEPWKLIISKDLPYFQNDYSLILTSFGVTDQNGKYLGSIISSIDMNLIQNILITQFESSENSIALISAYGNNLISQSNSQNPIQDYKFFTKKLGNEDYEKNESKFLEEGLVDNNIKYSFYKKLTNYPLVVISGYNHKSYRIQLTYSILKAIYPSILIGLLLIIILFFFYRRIVKPINHLSLIAGGIGNKNNFTEIKFPKINSPEIFSLAKALMRIKFQKLKLEKSNLELSIAKNRLEKTIEVELIKRSDLAQTEIVKQIRRGISKDTIQLLQTLSMLKHNFNNQIHDKVINLFLISNVEQGVNNITKFATDELSRDFFDIQNIISKVISLQEKEIKIRGVNLEVIYDSKLQSKIFVDKIRLIQVLSAILYKTILLLSKENTVKIFVKSAFKDKKKNLLIKIEDDGIGIGFKNHIKDAKKYGSKEEGSINGIDITVETIEELIALHHGKIIYNNKIQQGSVVTIFIPYDKKIKPRATSDVVKENLDNVIHLPFRK